MENITENIVSAIESDIVSTLQDNGIPAVAENSLDIAYEMQNALAKQGLAIVAAVVSLEHQGSSRDSLQYDASIELQILENPIINRARLKKQGLASGTAVDIALQAADALAKPGSSSIPRYSIDTISQTTQDGLLLVTVSIRTLI